jgi:cytochrome c oxidase subunit I+III
MVAFPWVAVAVLLVAFIGFGVWAHHMFAVGMATTTTIYFAAASMIVVIPSAIQLFAWLTTLVTGRPHFQTPLLWIIGFIVFFIVGGLSGVMFAAVPFDQQATDTYFVVAHFHFIIFGAAVFPLLGGMYYWFPKVTGRMYHEGFGKLSFWLSFVGSALTFLPMHILGLEGMPRRQYTYPAGLGWGTSNLIETLGSYVLGVGLLVMFANLAISMRRGPKVGRDPFDGATLEWATTSPPPPYNFAVIPTISSPYPMWDERDRENDVRRVARHELVLDAGHQTPASSVVDGELDEVLDMPSDSAWPPVLGGMLLLVTIFLLTGHWTTALVFAGAGAAVLVGWHRTEGEAERVTPKRKSAPNGWWGMAILLSTEASLFGGLIGTYLYLRFTSPQWPQDGLPAPHAVLPICITAALVCSCLPMWAAAACARRALRKGVLLFTALALTLQVGYLTVQIISLISDLHDFTPMTNAYGSIYYVMLFADHAHVLVGILLSLWLLSRVASGLTSYRVTATRAISLYWYVVAAITALVTIVQVSPS